MTLEEFLKDMSEGFLEGINLGNNNSAGLTGNNYPKAVSIINDGVSQFHKRFPEQVQREVFIQQYDNITKYRLNTKYAQTNTESTEPVKYIMDTPTNPFDRKVMSIIGAYNEVGCELPMNDMNNCESIFTPQHDIIQIPEPIAENSLIVIYQPFPVKAKIDALEDEIDIPDIALYALKLFTTSRLILGSKNRDEMQNASKYFSLYNQELSQLQDNGFIMSESTTNMKLRSNGWV